MDFKKIMLIVAVVIIVLLIIALLYCQLPMFGKLPSGKRLERVRKSPNYRDGRFCCIHETPVMVGNTSKNMLNFLFQQDKDVKPSYTLPSIKNDLKNLQSDEEILVWFGHSSYFLQISGRRILVDPVFSEVSSPIPFFPKAFPGTNIYQPEDMPEIDYLIITHDHWDHLDYNTILKLKPKIRNVVCPLGVGEHLEYWGFEKERLIEVDWGELAVHETELTIHCLPARHFSGRNIIRNKTLWASYLIASKNIKIYISGDSGYDDHFSMVQKDFGAVDLAILDSGQHNLNWRYIHMMTNEVVQAAKDLKTKILMPAHICKLALAHHAWDEPMRELTELTRNETSFRMLIPMIGEKIELKKLQQKQKDWWRKDNHE